MKCTQREYDMLRETCMLQLPTMAAVLASTTEDYDPQDIAEEALDLCFELLEAVEKRGLL